MEAHDFDKAQRAAHNERESEFGRRAFILRGQTFLVNPNAGYPAIKAITEIDTTETDSGIFRKVEDVVLGLIDPRDDAHARFHKACANKEFPVTFDDLIELQNWLLRESTSRPPTQPESSSTGQQEAGTTSTVASSPSTDTD